jgi:transcription initiation factor IIE alpha subunit
MKEFNKLVRDNMENVYNAIVKSGGQLVTITQMLPDLKGLDVNVIRTCLYRLKAKGLITYENGTLSKILCKQT